MGARLLVLGTAQDGGVPHAGCACANCEGTREDPDAARLVSCVAIEGASGQVLLIDATPDLPEQARRLKSALRRDDVGFDALLVTHAHLGHYLGLAYLGREAMHTHRMPVWGTPSMHRFLRANRPWAHLVDRDEVQLEMLHPGKPMEVDGVEVTAFLVPHRGEDTDTVAIDIRGPRHRVVYMSDLDVWSAAVVERLHDVDVALVDGTFYGPDEISRGDAHTVRHPFVSESIHTLRNLRGAVWFTHLNHTNPLLHPDPEQRPALPEGFGVAIDGMVFDL